MKLKNILFTGLAALALTACDDFLTVDAPSSYTEEFVFGQKTEINRALNGVYASILVGDLYGSNYQQKFIYNSDVEMTISSNSNSTHNSYARFDCDDQGSEINKFWNAAYKAIEDANRFINGVNNSPLYQGEEKDAEITQMLGEAKCLRAMVYHDLVVMFGDVPFTLTPSAQLGNEYVIPIADRETIQKALIEDLKGIAPKMASSNATTVERCSKEFAQALIARIALTAGGYSLRPDGDKNYGKMERPDDYKAYYQTAMEYAGYVINGKVHQLGKSYRDVFTKQCNFEVVNGGDVIFEFPFAKETNGNTGYAQGPTSTAFEGTTMGNNVWGEANGGARLNAFYPFMFDKGDKRRDFVNGLWYYGNTSTTPMRDTCYIRADYTVHNNKWSKLWANAGQFTPISTGNTGINFPYMRYADVLLMYAEAANEVSNGPTAEAIAYLKEVRTRAFDDAGVVAQYIDSVSASKADFLNAVLEERKFEFAGENIRWRDLVRNNIYGQELVYSFLRYYSQGLDALGGTSGYEDAINEHDRKNFVGNMPGSYSYHVLPQNTELWRVDPSEVYGYPYPNTTLDILYIWKPFEKDDTALNNSNTGLEGKSWIEQDFYQWGDTNNGVVNNQCLYSFYGYIRGTENGDIVIINNGAEEALPDVIPAADQLPVVRYILPYPNAAIQRSAGAYKNYYGYK